MCGQRIRPSILFQRRLRLLGPNRLALQSLLSGYGCPGSYDSSMTKAELIEQVEAMTEEEAAGGEAYLWAGLALQGDFD